MLKYYRSSGTHLEVVLLLGTLASIGNTGCQNWRSIQLEKMIDNSNLMSKDMYKSYYIMK